MKSESFRFTVFLAAISALTSLSIDMGLPAVPSIEAQFGLLPGRGALTLSFFLAGYALTPLAGGPISDRFGRRPVLTGGLALFALAGLACALAPTFPLILLARLLQGSAAGVCVALPLAIVRDLLEGHSARQRMSQVTTVLGVVPLLAPIVGSWVMAAGSRLHLTSSWRLIYAFQAVAALLVLAVVLLAFTESLATDRRQTLRPSRLLGNYRLLLTDRTFLGYTLIYALNFACVFGYISASPLILIERMGVSRFVYTLLFAVTAAGTILGSFASARFSKHQIPVRSVLTGGLLAMASCTVLATAFQIAGFERPLALLPFLFVVLFCFGLTSPALNLEALEPVPHLSGAGSGAIRSLQMILGSSASAFLAWFCARPRIDAAVATTVTMTLIILCSLTLYLTLLRPSTAARLSLAD